MLCMKTDTHFYACNGPALNVNILVSKEAFKTSSAVSSL